MLPEVAYKVCSNHGCKKKGDCNLRITNKDLIGGAQTVGNISITVIKKKLKTQLYFMNTFDEILLIIKTFEKLLKLTQFDENEYKLQLHFEHCKEKIVKSKKNFLKNA